MKDNKTAVLWVLVDKDGNPILTGAGAAVVRKDRDDITRIAKAWPASHHAAAWAPQGANNA